MVSDKYFFPGPQVRSLVDEFSPYFSSKRPWIVGCSVCGWTVLYAQGEWAMAPTHSSELVHNLAAAAMLKAAEHKMTIPRPYVVMGGGGTRSSVHYFCSSTCHNEFRSLRRTRVQ